jgi:hypothetical protein
MNISSFAALRGSVSGAAAVAARRAGNAPYSKNQ